MSFQCPYLYHGTNVLKNIYDIRDVNTLINVEKQLTNFRLIQLSNKPITGVFDLQHFKDIHKHIFKDIYEWAGEIRTVNMGKGNSIFTPVHIINNYSDAIFNGIEVEKYLTNYNIDKFSERLAHYSAEINVLHPFREGNGRSTREFIRVLAKHSGHNINYSMIDKQQLFDAYVKSFNNDISDLKKLYKDNIIQSIKHFYKNELPLIDNAKVEFFDHLHNVNKIMADTEFSTYSSMKEKYIELGKSIENGTIDSANKLFSSLSNVINLVRCSHMDIMSQNNNISIEKNISFDKEL